MNDSDGTTTSSPAPIPYATNARWSAAVQDDGAARRGPPTRAHTARPKSATRRPCATHPEARTSSSEASSSAQCHGRITGIIAAAPPSRAPAGPRPPPGTSPPALPPRARARRAPPAHQLLQTVAQGNLRGEAEHLARLGRVPQAPYHVRLRTRRAVLRPKSGSHHREQLAGESAEADLATGRDVEDLVGRVGLGGQQGGARDVRSVHEIHELMPVAEDERRFARVDPLHP